MIVKHIYTRYELKYFTKAEELKYLEFSEDNPIFYILIYKSPKKHLQINSSELLLSADCLPKTISAIIITNKRIKKN
jgi:hypothetical protein